MSEACGGDPLVTGSYSCDEQAEAAPPVAMAAESVAVLYVPLRPSSGLTWLEALWKSPRAKCRSCLLT